MSASFFYRCRLGSFLLFFTMMNAYGASVTDDDKHVLQFNKPYQRIISLAPDITEILFLIGAGDRLIGTVSGSDFPEKAKSIPTIGAYNGLDLEKIMRLKPDLVIVWGNTFFREVSFLKKLGVAVYKKNTKFLEDIPHAIRDLGQLTGNEHQARAQAITLENRLKSLREQHLSVRLLRVFFQLGMYGMLTINHQSWIHQAIVLCGGINVFASAHAITPQVNWESIFAAKPQVIVTDNTNPHWYAWWQRHAKSFSINESEMCQIPPDWIDRPGPRIIMGVETICSCLDHVRQAKR